MSDLNYNGTLHLYAQYQWHEEAFIVGDRRALMKLRNAIDEAFESDDGLGKASTFTADGEGYPVHVVIVETKRMERMRLPYTSSMFNHPDAKGRYPSSLVGQRPGNEILGDDEWFAAQRRLGMEFEEPGPVDVIAAASKPERTNE